MTQETTRSRKTTRSAGDERPRPRDGRGLKPPEAALRRVVIEGMTPEIDAGRFPAKRVAGDSVVVEADIFADGHDELRALLMHRRSGDVAWTEAPMLPLGNDRWRGRFTVETLGAHEYTIEAWVDLFATWRRDLQKRIAAGQDISQELPAGAALVERAAEQASAEDAAVLRRVSAKLKDYVNPGAALSLLAEEHLTGLMQAWDDRSHATRYARDLSVVVDAPKAGFSAWYEMFPRSASMKPGRHGTFADVEARLPYVAEMGFDVLYLPPIHPVGTSKRKGKNNSVVAKPGEPGSPWAIGSSDGGHKSVAPELGTLDDFRNLVTKAGGVGIDVALDIAFQCSPDHPYIREHPEWFKHRPDGTVQFAENPPKKYEDIYPFDFGTPRWRELWQELKSVFLFWMEQGVHIFRVDNPHTKPFSFWEWLIAELKAADPRVILLSEAFTRPRTMYYLAKLGFTQSYTYFTWRNVKWELTQYFTELTTPPVRDFFRPNVWPNTPDILTEFLQTDGPPAFRARLILAATLSSNYGIYGPAFELMEHTPREPGSEYLDSEKYEIKCWDINRRDSLRGLIARVNAIRRENPALQSNSGLRFHHVDNEHIICYSKETEATHNVIVTVVNLQPSLTHTGWVHLSIDDWGIEPGEGYEVHDLIDGSVYNWKGARNFVKLDAARPAHILRVVRGGDPGWRTV